MKADQLRISATEICSWADAIRKKSPLLASDVSFEEACLCMGLTPDEYVVPFLIEMKVLL